MWNLSINVMLFDHFEGNFRKRGPKVFIFDRFYKGFRNAFLTFEKPRLRLFYKAFRHGGMSCRIYLSTS